VSDDDFEVRPGRGRDTGARSGRRAGRRSLTLAAKVRRAAAKSGYVRRAPSRGRGTGHRGRGRSAALRARFRANGRRVVIKARVVRHKGVRFAAAPLGRHIAYLKRDGVTRDGRDAELFDAGSEAADGPAFAERCGEDRHHFRFIVSPEDAHELTDLRAFTRELMADVARDLDTDLDWVAADHWNTDNPHVHVLVRGRLADGQDLIIDRDYIREGMRWRAEARATLELGPRSEREIRAALDREVDAGRWTGLDARLERMAAEKGGVVDLRPGGSEPDAETRRRLLGRAARLERLGLADKVGVATWTLRPDLEASLRALEARGDIIKTLHRAVSAEGRPVDLAGFALHGETPEGPIVGRLIERGLSDELSGTAYAVIAGADGRTHHVPFADMDLTGDARPGAIVEVRAWADAGRARVSLAVRSDLTLDQQVTARGATWLDRQLVAREPVAAGGGFGADVREAMEARAEQLATEGLAHRQGRRWVFAEGLISSLRERELGETAATIARESGLAHRPSAEGEHVSGFVRQRVNLASGRFAVIDDGLGFQLVPWRPALEQRLGQHVSGVMGPGGVEWSFGRRRGLGL
jgi:type IV secretory pathway VirD2 relaxase